MFLKSQSISRPYMSMRILSVYYGNEIDDETVKYEIIQSSKSLRKIASSAIHNDSGYEGLETSGWKSPMESMAWTHVSGLLHSTRRHWRHEDQDGGGGAVLLVVLSVILFVFMGHGDESNRGGKTAAIQFYYNSLELARNSFGFY